MKNKGLCNLWFQEFLRILINICQEFGNTSLNCGYGLNQGNVLGKG